MDWKPLLKTFASIFFGFALGVASAKFGGRLCHPGPRHDRGPQFGPPGFDDPGRSMGGARKHGPDKFLKRFASDLSLTDEQQTSVSAIFEKQREKLEALHNEIFPKFDSVREDTRKQIRDVLNPEQQTKFDAIHKRMEAERAKRPKGPPFGPPPPDSRDGSHRGPRGHGPHDRELGDRELGDRELGHQGPDGPGITGAPAGFDGPPPPPPDDDADEAFSPPDGPPDALPPGAGYPPGAPQ